MVEIDVLTEVALPFLTFCRETDDIGKRKAKLVSLLDELVHSGKVVRFSLKTLNDGLADVTLFFSNSLFPKQRFALALDIGKEQIR